jgi:hypothetical protein
MNEDETLTLRDRFAIAALIGLLAMSEKPEYPFRNLAEEAYEMAELMLWERMQIPTSKKGKP